MSRDDTGPERLATGFDGGVIGAEQQGQADLGAGQGAADNIGWPDDIIAAPALFLASYESIYFPGEALVVGRGYMVQ